MDGIYKRNHDRRPLSLNPITHLLSSLLASPHHQDPRETPLKMLTTKSFLTLVALGLPTLALAAPTTTISASTPSEVETKPFTFSSWVDDLLNPSVQALTPEQAIEAYYASINSTTSSTTNEKINNKRSGDPVCIRYDPADRVNIADAVAVINEMAAQGEKYYTINAGGSPLWMVGAARLSGTLADTASPQRIWA